MARNRRQTIVIGEEPEEDDDNISYETHPLFPLDKSSGRHQKGFEVSYIQITRLEEGRQKWGPCIKAEELRTESDITERYGGGQFILIAREATKTGLPGDITKQQRLNLPGLPKPLSPDPTPEEQKLAAPHLNGNSNQSVNGGMGLGDPMSLFAMMMQMQQQSLERERQASEKAAQQSQQFMTMFMTVMQGSKSDSQNMIQMMMQMNAQQQQGMLQFITAMMSNRGGGPEEMAKYAELLKALGVGGSNGGGEKKEEGGVGSMLENVADIIQGVTMLKGLGAPPSAAAAPPTQEFPSGTGGASALLRGMRGG